MPARGGGWGSQGLPRGQFAGPRGSEGTDAGGGDQSAGQGGIEVQRKVGRQRGKVDLETADLKLQELVFIKPVL